MKQLTIFDPPQIVACELPEPEPTITPAINPYAINWWSGKADFYLRLMSKFMHGTRCPQAVRAHEIQRLHQLREQAKAQIQKYGG